MELRDRPVPLAPDYQAQIIFKDVKKTWHENLTALYENPTALYENLIWKPDMKT